MSTSKSPWALRGGIALLAASAICIAILSVTVEGAPVAKLEAKNPFKEALTTENPAITRADLLACTQLESAQVRSAGNLDTGSLMDLLNGTWIRELTWYGVPVQNESAIYYNLRRSANGATGDAMMFDQSNVTKGPLMEMLAAIKADPRALEEIPTIVFVDCDYLMIDKYYKVSDDLIFPGLEVSIKDQVVTGERGTLDVIWEELASNGFFDRRFPLKAGQPEMLAPTIGGSYWPIATIDEVQGDFQEAVLTLDGTYKFVHAGDTEVYEFDGREIGRFFMEGDAFVAAKSALGSTATGSNAGTILAGYDTDCDEIFFQVPVNYERVVIADGYGSLAPQQIPQF